MKTVVFTEISIDFEEPRHANAKIVIIPNTGEVFPSNKATASVLGVTESRISQVCQHGGYIIDKRNGTQITCHHPEDYGKHFLEVARITREMYADAAAYREMKAEEARREAERKAKEEAERKRKARIAKIQERTTELATELDVLNAELVELRKSETVTKEMAEGFYKDLQGFFGKGIGWISIDAIAYNMELTKVRATELCDALVTYGITSRKGKLYLI
jgi:hypothetical protein